jgi:cysteine desulfurase
MKKIYLDHAAAIPVDPRVIAFAEPYLVERMGNPSSLYSVGLNAKRAIAEAREKVAGLINAEAPENIVFTSGATESNNIAIRGTCLRNIKKGKQCAASAVEHISVLNPMKSLQKEGFEFTVIPVDNEGTVILDELRKAIDKSTTVTAVMYANNEIGSIQPIREISGVVHEEGLYMHVDGTAAIGHIPVDVQKDGIDLLTLSSNDLYGPQGVGALYIKKGVKVQSVLLGGGQERGLRSGTENVFGIVGMGEAARIAKEEMEGEVKRLSRIRDMLTAEILKIDKAFLTGSARNRLPHHASFRFTGIEGESILLNMDGYHMQISTGSACSSKTLEPSHVLLAIGLKHEEAHGSMVITLGRSNTVDQVPEIVKAVTETVKRLRKLSPLT